MASEAESDDPYRIVCLALRSLNLSDQYEGAFKDQLLTDELVQYCIQEKSAHIGQVIQTLGTRVQFEWKFKNLTISGRDTENYAVNRKEGWVPVYPLESTSSNDQPPPYKPSANNDECISDCGIAQLEPRFRPQSNPKFPDGPRNREEMGGEGRNGSKSEAQPKPKTRTQHEQTAETPMEQEPEVQLEPERSRSRLMLPQTQSQPLQDQSANPWKRIVEQLNLRVNSKQSILKHVVLKALDVYQTSINMNFQYPTDCFPDDQLEVIRSSAVDKAFCYLEDTLNGVDATSSESAFKSIEKEFEKLAETLAENNEKQRKFCSKILEEEAEAIYRHFVKSLHEKVLLRQTTEEEFKKILAILQQTSQVKFEEKCGKLPLFSMDILDTKISQRQEMSWRGVEQLEREYRIKREEVVGGACRKYEDAVEAAGMAEDFQNVHDYALKLGNKFIEDSGEEEFLTASALVEFEIRSVILKLKAERGRANRTAAVERAIQNLFDDAVRIYAEKMAGLSGSKSPIDEVELSSAHVRSKTQVTEMVTTEFQHIVTNCNQQTVPLIKVLERVDEALTAEYAEIASKNKIRYQNFEEYTRAVNKLKEVYSSEILKLAECCTAETFESPENTLRERLRQNLAEAVSSKEAAPQVLEALQGELTEFFDDEKQGAIEVFGIKQWEDEVAVKAALLEAKRYYLNEMDKRIESQQWFEEDKLQELHETVLERALRACADICTLNPRQEQLLREAFSSIYCRYRDENKCRMPNVEPAIGIDLGTTNCCIGVYIKDRVHIIPNKDNVEDQRVVPSFVSFNDDYTIDVGHLAKERAHRNVQNTIFDAKRLIGRKFDEQIVQRDRKLWPFEVIDRDNEPRILARGKEYRPEEISAKILYKLKLMAENYLSRQVKRAVITVPAYFTEPQRQATKHAAVIAGLEAYILTEPTAAAVAYKLNSTGDLKKNVLVFDLGGGTFDVVVIQIEMGKINVLAIGGDSHLGGEDFDHNMVEEILRRIKIKHKIDLFEGRESNDLIEKLRVCGTLRRLRHACEQDKRRLSISQAVTITLEGFDDRLPLLTERFTRDEFNNLNMHLFNKCIEIVGATLNDAKLSKDKIDDIVLVGGSTRIPKIQEILQAYFGDKKYLTKAIDPDEAVAFGAAYEAAIRFSRSTNSDSQKLSEGIQDVTPRSIGLRVFPDQMSIIIPKNTKIPCSIKKGGFVTLKNKQTLFNIEIYQGESGLVTDNVFLGKFVLTGIPPGPAGREQMECVMTIDNEGILHVVAHLVTNGKSGNLVIETQTGRMSAEELNASKNQDLLRWTPATF